MVTEVKANTKILRKIITNLMHNEQNRMTFSSLHTKIGTYYDKRILNDGLTYLLFNKDIVKIKISSITYYKLTMNYKRRMKV